MRKKNKRIVLFFIMIFIINGLYFLYTQKNNEEKIRKEENKESKVMKNIDYIANIKHWNS